uniref:Methyltransferase type 12 domain-containing protein n=1 Tax=Denticeps clupeoides TaxID=299321 RepID=A0AAY4BP62_9TELE
MLLCPAPERCSRIFSMSHHDLGSDCIYTTGQHVVHFAQEIPFMTWLPSDIKENSRQSISEMHLDTSEPWDKWAGLPHTSCDVIIAVNLLHSVPPWCRHIGKEGGALWIICIFDTVSSLMSCCRNPDWGLPDIDILRQQAFEKRDNNKCLVFRKL